MKILITGCNGMLGHDLQKEFADYDLVCVDKDELDITNFIQAEKIVKKYKPDYIINAAAYTDVDGCETNKDVCMKVNAEGPGNLAKICKQEGIVLVHYSTDYVFNGEKQDGYDENYDKIDPISVYGESKALGERLIKENTDKYYILRIAWLYGKNGKNFVDTMIDLSKNKNELKVVNDQTGSPTYTKDVAKQTRYIVDNNPDYGIYHTSNEGNCTWYDFAKKIFEIKNINIKINPVKTEEFSRPAKRPKYSILLNTKLPKIRSWDEALKEYLASNS